MTRKTLAAVAIALGIVAALLVALFGFANAGGDSAQVLKPTPGVSPIPTTRASEATATPLPASPTPAPSATNPPAPTPTSPAAAIPTVPPPVSTPTQPASPTQPPMQATPNLPAGRQVVSAPIDGLGVRTLESFPPQYVVSIRAGLPSGCAQKHASTVSRNGNTFQVSVTNTLPTNNVPCTLIYGSYELNLTLPGPFVSGATYTVDVNGKQTTFQAR